MKRFTLILSLLVAMVTTAMASDLTASTSLDAPEKTFTMTNGNGANVGANAVNSNTPGKFAFFAVDGYEDTYYIYSVDAGQWFDYDLAGSYSNAKNFVKMSDTQGNYFKITKCAQNTEYYEIRPYNTTGVAGKYLNYYQGVDGTSTLGLWQQNGDADPGSRYLLTDTSIEEVEPEALSTEYCYQIVNRAYGSALKDIDGQAGVAPAASVSTSDNAQLWAIEIADGKYKLKNRSTGNYLAGTTTASAEWYVNAEGTDLYIGVEKKGTTEDPTAYYYISASETVGRTCAHDANWNNAGGGKQVVTWDNNSNASNWVFVKTDKLVSAQSCTLTYNFVYGDNTVATQTVTAYAGDAYPAINIQAPYGVTPVAADLAFMSGTVTGDETIEIGLEVTKELPFETAASANDITTWYLVRMHTNQPGYIGDIAEDNTVNVAWGKSSDVANENFIWGFVGDVFSGITVVNKGTGMKLTSTGSGNVTLTDEGTSFFIAETTETTANATNGFCLRRNDSDQYLNANYGAAKLSHWGSTDAGSTFFLTEYEETEVTVSDAGWATMYLGYAVYVPEGVNAYTISGVEGNYVTRVAVEGVIPANTGVLLENEGNFTFKKAAKDAAAIATNLLTGTLTDTEIAKEEGNSYYILANGEEGIGFYNPVLGEDATKFNNAANKAYLVVPTEQAEGIACYSFRFGEGTTGIEEITDNREQSTVIYDLTGRRVEAVTAPGIYVVNGKKVLVK